MKKVSVLFFALLLSAASITAKELPIIGKWLLTVAEMEGLAQDVYSVVIFKEGGYAEMDGRVFGTWEYIKKTKSISIKSEMIKEFAGERIVSKPSKMEMLFSGDGLKLHFLKLDEGKIENENSASGLIGLWQFSQEGESTYLKFEAPDKLLYFTKSEYSTSSGEGMWLFNKDAEGVILLGNRGLTGNYMIKNQSAASFELQKGDQVLAITKIDQSSAANEKLNFTEDDIYKSLESGAGNINFGGFYFSWQNAESKTGYLKNLTSLSYIHSEFISELNTNVDSKISAAVSFDESYGQINMEPIFGELSAQNFSDENLFYPLELNDQYRITGDQVITVPAGSFNCKVVEAIVGYGDTKLRLYMIANRPGVYAKVIVQSEEGAEVFELSEIEDNFTKPTNKSVVGNWLMVNTPGGESRIYDFVNDGRIVINTPNEGSSLYWNSADGSNSIMLTTDGESQEFSIVTITDSKMELKNEGKTLSFVKWDLLAKSNKNSPLPGYWMLTGGSYDHLYHILFFDTDNSYSDIDGLTRMPLEENYKMQRGQWRHNPIDSTLIFKADDYQSSIAGLHSVSKLTESQFILNGKYVYTKMDTELFTKNNKESGLEGLWKIAKGDGTFTYYEFKAPYEFRRGMDENDQFMAGLWFYNPATKELFIGVQLNQLEGFTKIKELTKDKIIFDNGLEAIRVR